jgi:hypothetical protein
VHPALLAAAEKVPAMHCVQEVAPSAENEPAAHSRHTAPSADAYVPALHCVQTEDPAAATEPPGQAEQVAKPVVAAMVPAAQGVPAAAAAGQNCPAGQGWHTEVPPADISPALHWMQVLVAEL